MSFAEQERALFDLLFDEPLRLRFAEDRLAALADYDLDSAEQADFACIRTDALLLDAKMRRHFLLGHLCRALPVSFALVSSLDGGKTLLKGLLDAQTMRARSFDRASVYASRLREALTAFNFDVAAEQPLLLAIVEAELAMALTAASLKQQVVDTAVPVAEATALTANWSTQALSLAAHVGAALIPRPYKELKQATCAVADGELWAHLARQPFSRAARRQLLQQERPCLLLVRARLRHKSLCEPGVDHHTVELSEGFAPLLQHVDGRSSAEMIVQQLQAAGASEAIAESVRQGFQVLLQEGMLVTAAAAA